MLQSKNDLVCFSFQLYNLILLQDLAQRITSPHYLTFILTALKSFSVNLTGVQQKRNVQGGTQRKRVLELIYLFVTVTLSLTAAR